MEMLALVPGFVIWAFGFRASRLGRSRFMSMGLMGVGVVCVFLAYTMVMTPTS